MAQGPKPPQWVAPADPPVMDGLAGWWTFTHDLGTDVSGNGSNGPTNSSNLPYRTDTPFRAPVNGSLNLPAGGSTYVNVGTNTAINGLPNLSYAAWVYHTNDGTTSPIIAAYIIGNNPMMRLQTTGKLAFLKTLVGGSVSASAVPANQWTHVCCTHDGSTVSHYINGVLDLQEAFSATWSSPGDVAIGSDSYNFFEGQIGDVRIYNRVLSQAEVAAIYQWGLASDTSSDFIIGEMPIQAAAAVTDDVPFSQPSTARRASLGRPAAPPLDTIGATTHPHTVQPDLWASPVSQPRNPPRRHLSEMLVAPVAPSFFVDNGADHWFQPTPIIRGRRRENRVLDQDFFGDPGGTPVNYGFFQQPDARRPKRQQPTAFWDTYAPAATDTGVAQGWYQPTYRIQRPWRAPAAFNVVEDGSQTPSFAQTFRPVRRPKGPVSFNVVDDAAQVPSFEQAPTPARLPRKPVSFNVVDDATFTPAYQQSQRFSTPSAAVQPSGPIDDADAQGFYREEIPPRPLSRPAASSITSQPQANAIVAYTMAADTGVFVLNGQDATLTYTPVVVDTEGHSAGWPPAYTKEQLEQFLEKRRSKPIQEATPAAVQVVQVSPLVEPMVQPKIGPLGPLGAVGQAVAGDPEPEPVDVSEVIELIAALDQAIEDENDDEEMAIQVILGLI